MRAFPFGRAIISLDFCSAAVYTERNWIEVSFGTCAYEESKWVAPKYRI